MGASAPLHLLPGVQVRVMSEVQGMSDETSALCLYYVWVWAGYGFLSMSLGEMFGDVKDTLRSKTLRILGVCNRGMKGTSRVPRGPVHFQFNTGKIHTLRALPCGVFAPYIISTECKYA